jgi:hypothetical protein
MNPNNYRKLKKLREAMDWSSDRLKHFREKRMDAIRQYVGHHYSGEDGASDRVPINMLQLAVDTFQRKIAANTPQVECSTDYYDLVPGAADLTCAINFIFNKIDIERALNMAGTDGLFGIGAIKVGLDLDEEMPNRRHIRGLPFVEAIPTEDWIHDMTARVEEEFQYSANRYRVPIEWVKENRSFKKPVRDKAVATGNSGDPRKDGYVRPETMSRGGGTGVEEYDEQVDLWDIWLPRERLLVTCLDEDLEKPLRVMEWEGPDRGPFHLLSFGYVPGNVLPLAPAHMWLDLHELINRLFLKAARQAERQKTILGVSVQGLDDGQRIIEANDGDSVPMLDPKAAQEYRFGGADQSTTGLIIYLRDMFSYLSGNLDVIGGLGSQTRTLGQDKLLNENSSDKVLDMQKKMAKFVKGIATDVGWYAWEDPFINLPLVKRVAGTNIEVPFRFTPERRMGDYFAYAFDIKPFSLAQRSPTEQLNTIIPLAQEIIIPLMEKAGKQFDVDGFIALVAKYSHCPELARLEVRPMNSAPPNEMPRPASGQTTRNYVRHNIPGGSRQGKDQALAATLMGAPQQASEMAALTRGP